MATFIEVQSTGDRRIVIRASAIERLELPAGADLETMPTPEAPILLHLREGAKVGAYNKTGQQILVAILADNACVFLDISDADLSIGGRPAAGG